METVYWIWLSLRCGAGSELGSYLLRIFETPRAIFEADRETLLAVNGIDDATCDALCDHDLRYAERILEYCERVNVGILTAASPIYPDRLSRIHAKPLVLYYKGCIPDIDRNLLLACVGTRKCSPQGAATAERLGAELARTGAIVVSGMASGIDSAVQRGVLAVGGHTIAVLGCGIDRVYPPENENLMRRIAESGTLFTEFAPGTEPNGKNFPIRNRIISGLCQGTVVVEADMFSGSLITARAAIQQGRDIFAFPGNTADPRSDGVNNLIQEGATLVTCAADVVREYAHLYPDRIFLGNIPSGNRYGSRHHRPAATVPYPPKETPELPARFEKEKPKKTAEKADKNKEKIQKSPEKQLYKDCSDLPEWERSILEAMTEDMTADGIVTAFSRKTGQEMNVGSLLATLTLLEVEGYLEALPGGIFRRI